tara:strand:- start:3183 stop:3443 length:261 start_codon:yes stop_codon:yes gene_type:complete
MATKKYFSDKLVEVSNTYMSADGGGSEDVLSKNAITDSPLVRKQATDEEMRVYNKKRGKEKIQKLLKWSAVVIVSAYIVGWLTLKK